MFTVAQRDALRERVLTFAEADERVVAGAVVGSLAVEAADRFSDVDLTFGIADDVRVADVLEDWTCTFIGELHEVHLAGLERGPTPYRVLLLPDALQFDGYPRDRTCRPPEGARRLRPRADAGGRGGATPAR